MEIEVTPTAFRIETLN